MPFHQLTHIIADRVISVCYPSVPLNIFPTLGHGDNRQNGNDDNLVQGIQLVSLYLRALYDRKTGHERHHWP
jgi:hypothetical protein